ncbi:MAG: mechanosensitive ion channel [Phycisphaerales bacterium]|nr:MAG: mechanosensitive ion channel [Phycisphaerales bacterium]
MLGRRRRRQRPTAWVLVPLAVLPLMPAARAQDQAAQNESESRKQTSQPATQPAEATKTVPSELTEENLRTLIAQLEAAQDMPEATKADAINLCQQALEQLKVAATWTAMSAEYHRGFEETPQLLEAARQDLAQARARPTAQPVLDFPPDTTLEQLAQQLVQAEADLKAKHDVLNRLELEAKNRQSQLAALPDLLAGAKARLQEIEQEEEAPPAASVPPRLAFARRVLLAARKQAAAQEVQVNEQELRFRNARGDLLTARQDKARLDVAEAQARVGALQALVSERRQSEVERQKQQAQEELERTPQVIKDEAEKNKQLADERSVLAQRIDAAQQKVKSVADKEAELGGEFEKLSEMAKNAEMADVIGPQLRDARDRLNELRSYEHDYGERKKELNTVRLRQMLLEDERTALLNIDSQAEKTLAKLTESVAPARLERLEDKVRALFVSRRELVETLQNDYEKYVSDLWQLVVAEASLLEQVDEFRQFVDEHVLWLPSTAPIYRMQWPEEWSLPPETSAALGSAVERELRRHAVLYVAAVIVLSLLLAGRSRLKSKLRTVQERVAHPYTDSYRLTLLSLVYTILLALPWPGLLWLLNWSLGNASEFAGGAAYELTQALPHALRAAARLLLVALLFWHICRSHGLGQHHFRWKADAVRLVRRNLTWFIPVVLPLTILIISTEARFPKSPWRDSVGRLAFIACMVALAVFAQRLLHPGSGVFASWLEKHRDRWTSRLRYVWYAALVATPPVFALVAAAGYQYTAVQLATRFMRTVGLLLALLLLHALLTRAVLVAQRRIAIEQLKKKRTAQAEAKAIEAGGSEASPPIEESELNLVTIGAQTRHLLRAVVVFGLVIGVWLFWSDLLPALGFMEDVRLWSYPTASVAGGADGQAEAAAAVVQYITLEHVAIALFVAIATVVLAKNIPGLLEITLLQRLQIDAGARFAATTIARYVIILLGLILAFNAIGIGWSRVQWLAAAVTVGLGFGLQEIFANLVSGIMLLFERPIRIGDTVTVGDVKGTVTRIQTRATTITGWDRKELIIPNKEFITGQVINWTLSDSVQRIICPVGIAYGSNVELATTILRKIAQEDPHVIDDPAPQVLFMGFGDSSLQLELRVFIDTLAEYLTTIDRLHRAIDSEFCKAGIEIAFPQRDIHVRSIRAVLPVETDREAASQAASAEPASVDPN